VYRFGQREYTTHARQFATETGKPPQLRHTGA
jgi:hypothetical protein